MSAFVEHSFRGGFLLDETRLRKIKDIIESREKKSPDSKLIYHVYRGDSYSYETEAVDDVVNEDNEDWRRITRLVLHISRPAPSPTLEDHTTSKDAENNDLHFRLSLSDKEGCELRIAANDRDRVFLLFSDLRDYVQNEVTITRTIDRETSRFLGMLTSLVLIMVTLAIVAYTLGHVEPTSLTQVLRNPDIGTKLNYLIEEKTRPFTLKLLAIFVVLMGLSFSALFGPVDAVVRFIFPGNQFLFGKRKESFEKRQRLTSNLLWVVGVGCVVSIVAGLIVWRFTSTH